MPSTRGWRRSSRNASRPFEPDSRLPDPYDGLLDAHVGEPLPVHDCMGVSLYVEGKLWGALTLDALHAGTFDDAARCDLQRFTPVIEAAVRVTRLEHENRGLRLGAQRCAGVLGGARRG